jgi:hypothetical protein
LRAIAYRVLRWYEKLNAWAIMTYAECANALRDPRLKCERMEKVLSAKFLIIHCHLTAKVIG